ncbi:MAG: acylneuraminate cytidylyltransferase family protein [Desulfobacterales bacterium]|nr:MAG: acylneuraminate cytidylyltransferase family protein [Desulfobacterales bacterium]
MKPFVVGAIFARGGSKGLPRKNVRLLNGKPLIGYAIETALASQLINRVIVSTDDPEIAAISKEYGAEVPFMRPPELAQDDSPEWLAWRHAIQMLGEVPDMPRMDVMVSIPTTSPLRTVADVDRCIKKLLDSDADLVISVKPSDRNPYFNMVTLDKAGFASLVFSSDQIIDRRQDAPRVFEIIPIAYALHPEFVFNANSMFEGKVKAVVVPAERAIDIDTELDFKFAEFLMKQY